MTNEHWKHKEIRGTYTTLFLLITLPPIAELLDQYCVPFDIEGKGFQAETRFVNAEADRYPGWIVYNKRKAF